MLSSLSRRKWMGRLSRLSRDRVESVIDSIVMGVVPVWSVTKRESPLRSQVPGRSLSRPSAERKYWLSFLSGWKVTCIVTPLLISLNCHCPVIRAMFISVLSSLVCPLLWQLVSARVLRAPTSRADVITCLSCIV